MSIQTVTDYLELCYYQNFDKDNMLRDLTSSLINMIIENVESDHSCCIEEAELDSLLKWITRNSRAAELEALDWYDECESEDRDQQNVEPRVFGYDPCN